ncbi:MAG: DUF5309 domain-containing protein [Phycisphaerales bacterium]|nr:DUF5309 domain-containing protein [Phycisphaerales bacterium]
MPFTGKATFNAGSDLPELVEDVADIISIISPYETPLLDQLGDAKRPALSTVHEWVEDTLLPNTDSVNQTTFTPNASDATAITVNNGSRFRVGDQVRPENAREIMFVTGISGNVLTVVRRYGSTPASTLANGQRLLILGNAALEGDDRPATQFTNRVRKRNFTQIFTASVEVSGSMRAARQHGIADEVDFQKQERMRELLRDLENCVLNGVSSAANPQGAPTVRRTMNGILPQIATNNFVVGQGPIPAGGGGGTVLNEAVINASLRQIWEQSAGTIDMIICGGTQKRRFNEFAQFNRFLDANDTRVTSRISTYESDYGVQRILLSRWMPNDTVLFLDSSRLQVLPLSGRSFQYKPLAAGGDSEVGMVLGEYTLEMRNENAHGLLRGLSIA